MQTNYTEMMYFAFANYVIASATGAFGELSSVAEREVPCYLPKSFSHQVDQMFKIHLFLLQILTHFVTSRTQKSYITYNQKYFDNFRTSLN